MKFCVLEVFQNAKKTEYFTVYSVDCSMEVKFKQHLTCRDPNLFNAIQTGIFVHILIACQEQEVGSFRDFMFRVHVALTCNPPPSLNSLVSGSYILFLYLNEDHSCAVCILIGQKKSAYILYIEWT